MRSKRFLPKVLKFLKLLMMGVMTNVEIRSAFQTLTQAIMAQLEDLKTQAQVMAAQANRNVGPYVNLNVNPTALRVTEFIEMRTLEFVALGSRKTQRSL